jgi:hypothetical protein
MNSTPCPICNDLRSRRTLAFIRTEWHEFNRLQTELEKHQLVCEVINGGWYKLLWTNAVVVDAARAVKGGER